MNFKTFRKIFGYTEYYVYLCPQIQNMRVISFSMIRDFIAKHADADVVEKPSVFDPRGQAMLTLTGKI